MYLSDLSEVFSLLSFLFLFVCICVFVCVCLSSLGVPFELISSQQVTPEHCDLKHVNMSKRARASTMPNKVHSSTPTLQAPKVESGMSTHFLY